MTTNLPPSSRNKYDMAMIRMLLIQAFSDEDFTIFCYDYFLEVYHKFSVISFPMKVQLLLEHCEKQDLFDELLQLVHKSNPKKYVEFSPFIQKAVHPSAVTQSLQNTIVEKLYDYYTLYPDSPRMLFADLCTQLSELPFPVQVSQVRSKLFSLKKMGWINYDLTENDQESYVWIEVEGIGDTQTEQRKTVPDQVRTDFVGKKNQPKEVVRTKRKEKQKVAENVIASPMYPATLEELAQQDEECARLIKRDELLNEIKGCFAHPFGGRHLIVLYGQPMVGKTKLIHHLSEVMDNDYVPIVVTEQGLNALHSRDAYLFDLADQIMNGFREWTRRHPNSFTLNPPKWNDFNEEKGIKAFYVFWNNFRQIADKRQPIVIFDEIEHFLDDLEKLDRRILTFLDSFISKPKNGYFILAGSERIQYRGDEEFSRLIAKGWPVRVPHYNQEVTRFVFSTFQKYFEFKDNALQYCLEICDGHPRIVEFMFEAVVFYATRLSNKPNLEKNDLELILNKAIERTKDLLWVLWQRLSNEEAMVVWLMSRRISNSLNSLDYSLDELVSMANQYLTNSTIDSLTLKKGVDFLEEREWIEWKNKDRGLFHFKLGIFLFWVHRCYISRNEVIR